MTIRSRDDLEAMRRVGRVVALALRAMRDALRPGLTTAQVDGIGESVLAAHGARSAPRLVYDFPGCTCISVNEEIVHGIPGPRVLAAGDVVKLDVTAELDGYIADSATTVVLPPKQAKAAALVRCAHAAFDRAMDAARAGHPVSAIGRAVESEVRAHGFHVLRELAGHGVGRTIHEDPQVLNYYDPRDRATLEPGMVIAVEPMVSLTRTHTVEMRDGWTIRTRDRSLAAHYEHTILITERGAPEILTAA
jgi:methionyl aminopeptidase